MPGGYRVPEFGDFKVAKNAGPNTGNAQGNAAAKEATGMILHGMMDDLFPPDHWDTLLWEKLGQYAAMDLQRVLHVSSGSPSDDVLFQPEIQTKARFDQFGYWHHPSYESMFGDNEWTACAIRDDVVIEARNIVYDHRHPMLGKGTLDAVYEQENRNEAYRNGSANFEYRKVLGFPPQSEAQRAPKQPCIVVCLPGEVFHQQWVVGWTNLFGHLCIDLQFAVHMMFAHTSNVYCTRMEIAEKALEFKPEPDYAFFLDDDNTITREQFDLLYQDLQEHPELDGVVGWCWCDNPGDDPAKPWMMSCGRQGSGAPGEGMALLKFTQADLERMDGALLPIDWSGLPCCLFRFSALKRLGPEAFVPIVRADVKFGFTSEDTSFFWNARQAGLKFAVDIRVKVPHYKYRAIEPMMPVKQVLERHGMARPAEAAMP